MGKKHYSHVNKYFCKKLIDKTDLYFKLRTSYQLMPDRIKLKSQDLVKGLANTVLHSEVICIKLHKRIMGNKKKTSELQCSHLEVIKKLDNSFYFKIIGILC